MFFSWSLPCRSLKRMLRTATMIMTLNPPTLQVMRPVVQVFTPHLWLWKTMLM